VILRNAFLCIQGVVLATFLLTMAIPKPVLAEVGAKSLFIKYEDEGLSPSSKPKPSIKQQKNTTKSIKQKPSVNHPMAKNDFIGLQYWINLQEGNGRSRRVTTSHNFHSGDSIKLHIKSKSSGYLYVINQDSTGQQTYLYPTKGQEAHLIEPGLTYTIPARGAIRFDDVPGNEKLTIALAKYPITQTNSGLKPKESIANNSEQAIYSACASTKGMFVDDSKVNIDCIRNHYSAGTKGMFSEEDTVSTEPASYSVLPSSSLNEGKVMIVDFNLVHR
jgi:Domain of unknown function (DUF4384)